MTAHSQLTWRLRHWPAVALPSTLRLPRTSQDAFAPLYVQATLALLVVLMAVTSALVIGAKVAAPAVNPFTPYEVVFPGEPKAAALDQGFVCREGYNRQRTEFCSRWPEGSPIAHVGILVADGEISRITFNFHEGAFRVGDLPWAANAKTTPTRLGNHRLSYELAESALRIAARSEQGEFSPFLELQWVSFGATP
jgi:hypothetical protein